jgi:hypothetical protein
MELKIAAETDQMLWDGIVQRSPNGTLFHTWKWLKLMEKYSSMENVGIKSLLFPNKTSAKLYPLILVEKDHPAGIFPLFFLNNPAVNFCYSPPHSNMGTTPYLGPLFPELDTIKEEKKQVLLVEVQKEVDRFIKKNLKSNYILLNTPPEFEDCRAFKWSGYTVEPRYTYYIDLKLGKKKIWDGLSRTLKQDINKVINKGIRVETGSKKEVEYIYELLKKRNRIDTDKEYILQIFDNFAQENLNVFIARHENELLSGGIIINYKKKVSFWVGTPRFSYEGTTPNTLIYWETINWAIEKGFDTFEIIGADDYSLFPFKRKFNGKIIPYYQMKWMSPSLNLVSSLYQCLKTGDSNQLEV